LPRALSRTQSFAIYEINWKSIAGMRDVLVRDYFEVDFETVWNIVERDLPPLEKALR
jgi:uncharacterized protein with HEPN domain